MDANLEKVGKLESPDKRWASVKDDWETPYSLYAKLNLEFNFDVDVAANSKNTKCPVYIPYPEVDALQADWNTYGKRAFMNPPYSNWHPWAKKAVEQSTSKNPILVVGLLPVDTSTRAFHQFIYRQPNAEIRFLDHRLRFEYGGIPGPSPARFASMVVLWRPRGELWIEKHRLANELAHVNEPAWVVKK